MKLFLIICFLILAGCSSNQKQVSIPVFSQKIPVEIIPPPIRSSIVADKDCSPNTWNSEWDTYIIDSLSTKSSLKNFNTNPKYWVAVVKSIAKAESCLKLTERYVESGLGKDAVTGLQNTSEGLLQLSYQDSKYHGCQFFWEIDKKLDVKSFDKTIFNPKFNLECGMIILDKQIKARGVLETSSPYYWAVLNKSNKRFSEFKKYLAAEGF
jgi:hypothetical protein